MAFRRRSVATVRRLFSMRSWTAGPTFDMPSKPCTTLALSAFASVLSRLVRWSWSIWRRMRVISSARISKGSLTPLIPDPLLEAQRDEALELAAEAHERGDEAEELRETVRAVSLDREPLPQLSAGAWQLSEEAAA